MRGGMKTTPDDLVRYVSGRLRWISPQGVELVFNAARDFYAQDKPDLTAAEKAITMSMGFS